MVCMGVNFKDNLSHVLFMPIWNITVRTFLFQIETPWFERIKENQHSLNDLALVRAAVCERLTEHKKCSVKLSNSKANPKLPLLWHCTTPWCCRYGQQELCILKCFWDIINRVREVSENVRIYNDWGYLAYAFAAK